MNILFIISRIIILIITSITLILIYKRVHIINYHINTQSNSIYEEMNNLNTGDIILFYGTCYDSYWIKFFKNSNLSHCGLIVRDPNTNELFIWNNTVDIRNYNLIKNDYDGGCQLNCFENLISLYQGNTCIIRKLTPGIQQNKQKLNLLKNYINELTMVRFTSDPWNSFFSSELDFIKPPNFYKENWCTWLILHTYQHLKIIDKSVKGHKISSDYFLKNNISFLDNHSFSKPYYITIR